MSACKNLANPTDSVCTASTTFNNDFVAANAMDGDINKQWATNGQGAGAWIQFTFSTEFHVIRVELDHRCTPQVPQCSVYSFSFSGGKIITVSLIQMYKD